MFEGAPDFTVIIPSYNRQSLLNEAILSVIAQTHRSWELIVIDDCSPIPLGTPPDDRIRLFRQSRNGGRAKALNIGISQARGHFIAFLDDDDLWLPERLANAYKAHLSGDIAICHSGYMGGRRRSLRSTVLLPKWATFEDSKARELPQTMNAISVSRAICAELNETFLASADIDWAIRMRLCEANVAWVPSEDVAIRRHDGPRHRNGTPARIEAGKRLLMLHESYYERFPRQRAFRIYRIGRMAHREGQSSEALRYAVRSLRCWPSLNSLALVVAAGKRKGNRKTG